MKLKEATKIGTPFVFLISRHDFMQCCAMISTMVLMVQATQFEKCVYLKQRPMWTSHLSNILIITSNVLISHM